MGKLKDLVRQQRASVGQAAGQDVGQAPQEGVPPTPITSRPLGQQKPQNSAEKGDCPTVPPTKGRDSGTATYQDGTTGGTRSGTAPHPKIIEAKLREWHAHLSRLDLNTPLAGIPDTLWVILCDDCWFIYENFSRVALESGWTAQSLFGVNVENPPAGGIAQLLQSSRSVVFSGPRAVVRSYGVTFKRNSAWAEGCPLIWELGK
jgi:hypothetical protein